MRLPMLVLMGWCLGCVVGKAGAGEAPATVEQVAAWINQLGSDDFDVREKAEAALAKAGAPAVAELQKSAQSNDPEIRARSARLLEQLRWEFLPNVSDLAAVLPQDNIFFVGTPSMKDLIARLRKETALGRLYDHPGLRPLREVLWELGLKESGADDDGRKLLDQWFDRFGGPYGMAFTYREPEKKDDDEDEQFATFLGVTGAQPQEDLAAFSKMFPLHGTPVPQVYRGVSCRLLTDEEEGLALVKNLIVRSNGPASMFAVIDAVVGEQKANLAGSAFYQEARKKVSGEPLGLLFFNMKRLMESWAKDEDQRKFAEGMGLPEWKYGIVALGVQDGLFVEQAFCKLEGPRRGLAQLLSFEPLNGRLAALCPPDSLLFVSIPVDAKASFESMLKVLETANPELGKQTHDMIQELLKQQEFRQGNEQGMDPKIGGLKGEGVSELAFWLSRPQGPNPLQPPDVCGVFEAPDVATATKVVEALAKAFAKLADKEDAVASAEYQGRRCYYEKKTEEEKKEEHFCFSWCADGARVLLASNQEALQRMILRATQGLKGLDAKPDFQKLLAAIPQEERGGLLYLNSAEAFSWGYAAGLLALSADAPEDLKGKLAQLPKDPQELFKDFPGTLLSVRGQADGIRARAVGGMPAGFVAGVPLGLFWMVERSLQHLFMPPPAQVGGKQEKAVDKIEAPAPK